VPLPQSWRASLRSKTVQHRLAGQLGLVAVGVWGLGFGVEKEKLRF